MFRSVQNQGFWGLDMGPLGSGIRLEAEGSKTLRVSGPSAPAHDLSDAAFVVVHSFTKAKRGVAAC